jgi:histidinol-phosphate aminotransferase
MRETLRVALPKGRLLHPCLELFQELGCTGLRGILSSRRLLWEEPEQGLSFMVIRPTDVPIYVEHGAADLGIVGRDVLREEQRDVYEPMGLGFGRCRLVVAGPPEIRDENLHLRHRLRVATKYPRLARQHFLRQGISAEVVSLSGSVELAPQVGLADLIVDIVDTGRTLRENNLVEIDEIMTSEACLIVNRASHKLRLKEINHLIKRIADVIEDHSKAQRRKGLGTRDQGLGTSGLPPLCPTSNFQLPTSLLRRDIYKMKEYAPIEPFEVLSARLGLPPERIIKLDGNENPYGPSPRALAALANYRHYHIYPDPQHTLLREAVQDYIRVDKAHIMFGNGSDELIDLIMRLFLGPGEAIINCPPTFGMYSFDAAICGAQVVQVPRRADFSLDVEGIRRRALEKSPVKKLLFVNSPNNPDGSVTPREALLQLLELPLVVVVDEAYAEFSGTSVVGLVPKHPNLIVLRTFSKWAGLAGLRIGYGVFPLDIVRHLWKIKQPYNLNVAAQAAALASLEDLDYLRANVQRIVAERERLYTELGKFDFLHPYPSQSNFILCRVLGRDARQLRLSLEREGILVRYFDKPYLRDCIRISVGKPEHTDALLAVLGKIS